MRSTCFFINRFMIFRASTAEPPTQTPKLKKHLPQHIHSQAPRRARRPTLEVGCSSLLNFGGRVFDSVEHWR